MKHFIHRGFFTEVFRQLKTAGIVMACILMLFNVGTFFTNVTAMISGRLPDIPSDSLNAVYMMLYIYVASLVLTFIAFNWLNHRSTSDFFHALPIRRTQMYRSTFLAIVLWIVIAITGYAAVHALLYLATGMPFNYLSYLCVFVNMLIGIVHVVGIVSLACALSGTRFVNLFSAAVMLFIPRALLLVLAGFTYYEARFLPVLRTSFLFDPSFNIFGTPYISILGGAAGLISGNHMTIVRFTDPVAMVYSLVHACVLAFIGMLAFRHRPSEAAGMPMRSRIIQGVIRTAFGLPLLLVVVFMLLTDSFDISATVILVLFSFTFYCLYELISTKSAKRMLRSMPLFAICVGIAALYLFVPKLIGKASAAIPLESDDIRYITIEDSDMTSYYSLKTTYENLCARSVRLDDPITLKSVERAYRRTVNKDPYLADRTVTVRIHRKNGGSILRHLDFTLPEYEALMRARSQDAQFAEQKKQFPKGVHYFSAPGLTVAEANEIGRILEEEYAGLDQSIGVTTKENAQLSKIYYRIKLCGVLGIDSYYNEYEITNLTPKAAQRYTELLFAKYNESLKDEIRLGRKWLDDGMDAPFSIQLGNIAVIDAQDAYYNVGIRRDDGRLDPIPKNEIPEYVELYEMLLHAEPTDRMEEGVTLVLDSHYSQELLTLFSDYSGSRFYVTVKLTDEQVARIIEIVDMYDYKSNIDGYDPELTDW